MIAAGLVVILVVLNTAGQMLLKKSALGKGFRSVEIWVSYLFFMGAVGVSFILLHYVDLKYFIVVMNLNYVAVMLSSRYFFGEKLSRAKIAATALVLLGIGVFVGV